MLISNVVLLCILIGWLIFYTTSLLLLLSRGGVPAAIEGAGSPGLPATSMSLMESDRPELLSAGPVLLSAGGCSWLRIFVLIFRHFKYICIFVQNVYSWLITIFYLLYSPFSLSNFQTIIETYTIPKNVTFGKFK